MSKEKHYSNFFGYLAHIFTTNKPLSLIVLFSAIVIGFISYVITPKQYNPEVIRPAFVITTEYFGASADEVDNFVSKKIVQDIREIPGIDKVQSQSFSGGYSLVTAMFHVGENEEDAKTKIFTKILENTEIKKPGISNPYIASINPDDVPILTVNISSLLYDQNHLREIVFENINELNTIKGVSGVEVYGGENPSIRIELEKEKMQVLGVTLPEVLAALENQNKKIFASDIGTGYRKISLELDNRIYSTSDLEDISIQPGILLSDIATIQHSYTEKNNFIEFHNNGENDYQNVFISFAKKKGTNTINVSRDIQSSVSEIFNQENIEISFLRDNGSVAKKEINNLMVNLLISIGIVGLVLYLFLSLRPAAIVMAAIPIILLLVFIPGFLAGQTINRITLFALILSLGLLVDSATVVVENIYRNIRENREDSIHKNVVSAVNQVGVGLVLSIITSIVVFFPVKFITGMMGPYMGPIAFFVPVALTISLLTAFIITPFVAHFVFSKNSKEEIAPLDGYFNKISSWYGKKLTNILTNKRKIKVILLGLILSLIVALSFPLLRIVHFQMLPKADKDQVYVHIDYPSGTDILINQKFSQHIIDEIMKHEDVNSIQSFIGAAPIPDFNGLFKGVQNRTNSNQSTLRINLKKERNLSSINFTKQIRSNIEKINIPYGTVIKVLEDPPGPPVQATFVLELYGEEVGERQKLLEDIHASLSEVSGLVDVDISNEEPFEKNILKVNHRSLSALGIPLESLYSIISTATSTYTTSQFYNGKNEYSIIEIGFSRDERDSFDDILNLKILNNSGDLIPISEIVDIERTQSDQSIYRMNGETYSYITGEVENRSIVYVVLDSFKEIKSLNSLGYTVSQTSLNTFVIEKDGYKHQLTFDGEWDMTLSNFRDLGIAMIAALFLVYAILVAQYKSFLVPGLIMVTIPLGLVGILFGFTLLDLGFNIYLTATALIGFIALIGIVVNNAILYLEYFIELINKNSKIDYITALVEAGKVRLRPIMLTSLTTVLANLTIISDPVWSGLGWAIIFGLSLSTIMTLVVFPILYVYFNVNKKHF